MADGDSVREPKVLVPYPGPATTSDEQDIFVYLRPESNGVLVESTLLRVIERCPEYRTTIRLVYLANVPGDYIVAEHTVEEHYAVKFSYAVYGKQYFTPHMKETFSDFFGVPFDSARIIGAFEALRELETTPEELFRLWVPAGDVLVVNGQNIKRTGDVYVVNYDMPALLHKNNRGTDFAVMIFRTALTYDAFSEIVTRMHESLVAAGLLEGDLPVSRVFHYSKGPFEQILDGIGYLFSADAKTALADLTFCRFLADRKIPFDEILGVIRNPICRFTEQSGTTIEENIFVYTKHDSYAEALRKYHCITSQVLVRR